MRAVKISDDLWAVIEPVLPPLAGRRVRPWNDHRLPWKESSTAAATLIMTTQVSARPSLRAGRCGRKVKARDSSPFASEWSVFSWSEVVVPDRESAVGISSVEETGRASDLPARYSRPARTMH
ncbi:hypothetical protein [Rhodococcus qingshengii]|uniref:hypothetical protein n=1 Tax=Rhodococcus qingshengii TaxID=334542 RepID=UPI0036DC5E75